MTRFHSIDYIARDQSEGMNTPRRWIDRGFWWTTPRLSPLCRLLGHRPVVDGHGTPGEYRGHVARWVACDRCGVRPDPQGSLDPERWQVGYRYDGPLRPDAWRGTLAELKVHRDGAGSVRTAEPDRRPGSWPAAPEGVFGGQVLIGADHVIYGAEVKVGNSGSEHTLAGQVNLGRLGALYLHTEEHGTWLQRRLNPTGYDSRVTGFQLHDGLLVWHVWAKRDHSSRDDPRWQHGMIRTNPLDRLLGPKRYHYENVGEPVDVLVRMPHGDEYTVTGQLQRESRGRDRQWWPRDRSWSVDWHAEGDNAIPTKPGNRGRVYASAVKVTARAAHEGTWPHEAAAQIAASLAPDRSRYGYTRWLAEETA